MLRSWIAAGDWTRKEGPVLLPQTEINEGDWVYADGKAVLCALTPGPLVLSSADAIAACLSLHATVGNSGPRIPWDNQSKALAILREAAASTAYPALTSSLK
jgi:hypothetical protein